MYNSGNCVCIYIQFSPFIVLLDLILFFQIHESESSDTESCKGIGREEDDEPEDIKMPENASMEKLIQEARMKAAELREKSMVTFCTLVVLLAVTVLYTKG